MQSNRWIRKTKNNPVFFAPWFLDFISLWAACLELELELELDLDLDLDLNLNGRVDVAKPSKPSRV